MINIIIESIFLANSDGGILQFANFLKHVIDINTLPMVKTSYLKCNVVGRLPLEMF